MTTEQVSRPNNLLTKVIIMTLINKDYQITIVNDQKTFKAHFKMNTKLTSKNNF